MSKGIHVDKLGAAIEQQLTIYSEEINDRIAETTMRRMDDLVRLTKATAPKGKRGNFRKNITSDSKNLAKAKRAKHGGLHGRVIKSTWYVKAPDYRLTHLLVHGHATRDGGRTKPNPFLQNALDRVLPEFEKDIEEVLQNGE